MSKVVTYNHTDTAISGVSANPLNIGLVNWGADHRVEKNLANELILTNMKSPIGAPEKFRYAWSTIADVYKGTEIEVSYRSLSKKGIQLLCQHTDILTVTDSVDATFEEQKPIKCNITITYPADTIMTAALAKDLLSRTISGLFETGVVTDARIGALLRGSLLPADLK